MPIELSGPTLPTVAWLTETHLNEIKITLETKTRLIYYILVIRSLYSLFRNVINSNFWINATNTTNQPRFFSLESYGCTCIRKAGVCLPEHTDAHPGQRKMSFLSFADVRLQGHKLELDIQRLTDVWTPPVFLVHARPGRKQATATEDFDFHISYI